MGTAYKETIIHKEFILGKLKSSLRLSYEKHREIFSSTDVTPIIFPDVTYHNIRIIKFVLTRSSGLVRHVEQDLFTLGVPDIC